MSHKKGIMLLVTCAMVVVHLPLVKTCSDFCHVDQHCDSLCPSLASQDETNALRCDETCRKSHCLFGCHRWTSALNTSCSAICGSTDGHYCLRGCKLAVSYYVKEIKGRIGSIAAPFLIRGSVTNTSLALGLKWNSTVFGWLHFNRVVKVAFRWCSHDSKICGSWEDVSDAVELSGQSQVVINDLQPYSTYRFRLVIALAPDHDPLMSEESAAILTMPSDFPSSPPTNLQVVPLDSNRISVSWEPPLYPNAPLVSYLLTIHQISSEIGETFHSSQDIGVNDRYSFTFGDLQPNTSYVVSVTARNFSGRLGVAANRSVFTFPLEKFETELKPYFLIVADGRFILRHELAMTNYYMSPIYESTNSIITGLAVHARQGIMFVAKDDGIVYELSLKTRSDLLRQWRADKDFLHVGGLSVDWLFNNIYLLIQNSTSNMWFISRCKLDCRDPFRVVKDLGHKPSHFEVDPFNGFLVWAVNRTDANGGLYVVDLADLSSNQSLSAAVSDGRIRHIVKNVSISSFSIDPINARIFIVDSNLPYNRTIVAIPYTESTGSTRTLRHTLTLAEDVSFLTYLNGAFSWINSGHLAYEEVANKTYFVVNTVKAVVNSTYTALVLCDVHSQSKPVPMSPVQKLEAFFGSTSVHIKWEPPLASSHQGRGAWQSWIYHIQIGDSIFVNTEATEWRGINTLRPNTTYTIVVQPTNDRNSRYAPLRPNVDVTEDAFSKAAYFFGKTLADGEDIQVIYWTAYDGTIYQSNTAETNVSAFSALSFSHQDRNVRNQSVIEEGATIISTAWMYDTMYVVTNTSNVYMIDMLFRTVSLMEGIEASSVATDWLAHKVYWSSSNRQTIGRCFADGSEQEWLPLVASVKWLAVHSTKGKLVWCTDHSVEGSFLNAESLQIYWSSGLYSGSRAMGMTIDYDRDYVYWIVKNVNGASFLYKSHIDLPNGHPTIHSISLSAKGPLQYVSNRLIWLQADPERIIFGDLNGTNTYQLDNSNQLHISGILPGFSYSSMLNGTITVIPDPVDETSIQLGTFDRGALGFTWLPVKNVNYGEVSYSLRISYRNESYAAVTIRPQCKIPETWKILPYTEVGISIMAYTVWGSASVTNLFLRSPPSIPEVPLRPRAYVSFAREKTSPSTAAVVFFRWSPPENSNGVLLDYRISCRNQNSGKLFSDYHNISIPANTTEYIARNLAINETYLFTVKASTRMGYGSESTPLSVSTAEEIPIPQMIIFTESLLWLIDLDKQILSNQSVGKEAVPIPSPPVTVSFISHEKEVYWIDNLGDLYYHDLRKKDIRKIHHMKGENQNLVIDWVSRRAYWSQREPGGSPIYQIDLSSEKGGDMLTTPQIILRDSRMIKVVEIDPFTSRLIWISDNLNGTGTFVALDISNGENHPFLNDPEYCGPNISTSLVPKTALQTVTTVDWSDMNKPRLLWLAHNGEIWSTDLRGGCHSTLELSLSSTEIETTGRWLTLAVDRDHFFWTGEKDRRVHKARRTSVRSNEGNFLLPANMNKNNPLVQKELLLELKNVFKLISFFTNFPSLPAKECLIPAVSPYFVKLVNSKHDSLILAMPEPHKPGECKSVTMATPYYHLFFGPVLSNQSNGCLQNISLCNKKTSTDRVVVLEKLLSYTHYAVHVSLTNNYLHDEKKLLSMENAVIVQTQAGAPSKPKEVIVTPTSPTSIRVQWLQSAAMNGGKIHVKCSVRWQLESRYGPQPESLWKLAEDRFEDDAGQFRYFMNIDSLKSDSTYTITVRAYSDSDQWNESDVIRVKTYENPKLPVVKNVTSTSIFMQWKTQNNTYHISRHILEFSISRKGDWTKVNSPSETKPGYLYNFTILDLSPLTSYSFRLKLMCLAPLETSPIYFYWPSDEDGLLVRTKGNIPDQPLPPKWKKNPDNVVELWWAPTATNGFPIVRYVLEMRGTEYLDNLVNDNDTQKRTRDFPAVLHSAWKPIYNGSERFYLAQNLTIGPKYQFRVQAINDMGSSEFSEPSEVFYFTEISREGTSDNTNITMSVLVSALIAFCSVMAIFLFYVCRRTEFKGKKANGNNSTSPSSLSEMTDLATLRELPRRESFVQQNNAIYGVGDGDLDQELALLPHIRFEDLLITKFLGRGAFGEVFEGTTCNLPGSNQYHTKVAVKTLRKGATDQEKGEFLKEAILMSQFKHKHILRLLGVCLDADPNFILLELMEGGDLLSFLRSNRPSMREQPPNDNCFHLGLLDLVSMCVDVAKGCCYLEELHFVHRDLAARNCLVSSREPHCRVVKIGDFGLARDIYRNDYYRKEGEGLLPVRWMAPESLVDGVFTSQTDVWSFGVLLWEILTFGQQPYPARTNLQVLHFVRTGGRLDRPPNCPDSLFELMISCWSYESSARPTFTKCLAVLLNLQDKLEHSPFTAVHNDHYIGTPLFQSWEMNRDTRSSCSYLDEHSLEQGAVLYTNDIAAVLNGLVCSDTKESQNRSHGLEKCSSGRVKRIGQPSVSVLRSNSITEGTRLSVAHGHDRYLELLSDSGICIPGCNGGYEVPRNECVPLHTSTSNRLQTPNSSSSAIDNDNSSALTDD